MFKNRCYNGGNRHNFKPRYTEKNRNLELSEYTGRDLRHLLTLNVYVGDVCVWCGKTVNDKEK